MTDTAPTEASRRETAADKAAAKPAMSPFLKLALEIGPLAIFFITFTRLKDIGELDALIWATGAFMAALMVSLGVTYALTRTVSRVAAVTAVVVLVMGGLTIWLQSDIFIKMKPTIIYALFAGALAFGLTQGQSYLRYLLGELLPMTEAGWMKLTRNWTLFFVAAAALNELVWRTQSTETWVDVKTFAYPILTVVFTFSQTALMSRHAVDEKSAA